MSVPARVFLSRDKQNLIFNTVWIEEEPEQAIEKLGLGDVIPDGTVFISFSGRYAKYQIGKRGVFVLMVAD